MTMPDTTQSDLPDGCPTCGALPCDWAAGGADAAKTVEALLADREKIESQIDGGRFDEWPTATFVGQLRMQSRDSLDPEYSQFMAATATHLGILSGAYDAQREIAESAKEDAARLRAHCEALEKAMAPFLDLKAQRGAHGVISKKLNDFAPMTVTVTKAQMLEALTAYRGENANG